MGGISGGSRKWIQEVRHPSSSALLQVLRGATFSAFRLVSSQDQTCNAVSCIMRAGLKAQIMGSHVSNANAQLQRASTLQVRDDTNETPLPRASLVPQDQAIMWFFNVFAAGTSRGTSVAQSSLKPPITQHSVKLDIPP